MNITCSARALPDPVNLLLMKDGTIIHQNQSTVVDNSTSSDSKGGTKSYQFQLIQNVEIQQAVNYSCRAINNVGYSDSDIISIEVYWSKYKYIFKHCSTTFDALDPFNI